MPLPGRPHSRPGRARCCSGWRRPPASPAHRSGTTIHFGGQRCDAITISVEGSVIASVTSPGGRRLIFKFDDAAYAYGLAPLIDGQTPPHDVVADGPVTVIRMPYAAIRAELARLPALWESIAVEANRRGHGLNRQIQQFVSDAPLVRAAALLLGMLAKNDQDGELDPADIGLRLPQERLADFRGRCITLGPGSYGNLSAMDPNDRISSLRPSNGPPAYGGAGGDDGSAPEVSLSGNRSGRVTFQNGCVAYYNASGQRFQNLPACHGRQIQRADEAMARYRSEQGLDRTDTEHPWASSPGYSGYDPTPPEIIMGTNREGEVIYRNNCVVYYDASGRRWKQPSCSGNQVRQADVAMAVYRREQGM
jgi:hypothetical protein